jgi:beta-phosphoglucomutase-like phosphatase (HAD superfamily)
MNLPGTKGVLLDIDNVLLWPVATPAERFAAATASYGWQHDAMRLASAFGAAGAWWHSHHRRWPLTTQRETEDWICYYGIVLQELGIDPEDATVEEVAAAARLDRWLVPVDGVLPALAALTTSYAVGIAAVALPSTQAVLDAAGLTHGLRCCLLAPDPAGSPPFQQALLALDLPVAAVTYVSASDAHRQAALAHGMHTSYQLPAQAGRGYDPP